MVPILLNSSKRNRSLAVLTEPVPCPCCRRMAMLVVLTPAGGSCIGCSP